MQFANCLWISFLSFSLIWMGKKVFPRSIESIIWSRHEANERERTCSVVFRESRLESSEHTTIYTSGENPLYVCTTEDIFSIQLLIKLVYKPVKKYMVV